MSHPEHKLLKYAEVKPTLLNQQLGECISITVIFPFFVITVIAACSTQTLMWPAPNVLKSAPESGREMRSDIVRCDSFTEGSVVVLLQLINS